MGAVETGGLVHYSDRDGQYLSIRYTARSVWPKQLTDYYTRQKSCNIAAAVAILMKWNFATLEWIDWFNNRKLLEPIGNIPSAESEMAYYRRLRESAGKTYSN